MLSCPACHHDLQVLDTNCVKVDACVGHCGGVWFDNRELQRMDEPAEAVTEAVLHVARDPGLKVDMQSKRHCPVCQNMVMMRHYFSVKRKVEVDECAQCGGIWLDADELEHIRGEFKTAADREQAALDAFHSQFDDQMAVMRAESQAKAAQADRFARMFQWICPSRYIPGKQSGGAF